MSSDVQRPTENPARLLRENAGLFPDKLAIAAPTGELSYRAFEARSDAFAWTLHEAGLRQGTKTILMIKPGIDLYVMAFALLKIGAIPVVVDPGMGIKRLLHSYKSVAAEAFVGIPLAHYIRILTPQFFPHLKVKAWLSGGKLSAGINHSTSSQAKEPFPIARVKSDDLGITTFTTGSTGPAKPVEASYGMVLAIVDIICKAFQIGPEDRDLATVPFFGIVSLSIGATVVIPEMDPGKPADVNPSAIISTIHAYKITSMFASPALLDKLGVYALKQGLVMPSLRCVNSGGAPITLSIMKSFRAAMPQEAKFYTGWGATEGLPLAAIEDSEIIRDLIPLIEKGLGTPIGRAMPGVQVRFIRISHDPIPVWSDALLLAQGEIGEIVVQGPNVSRAYHQSPASDAAHKIRDPDGKGLWHRTGDLGWIDAKGRIFFCGRIAHSFVNEAGELMHSVACEGVSNAHPKVKRSALVPVGQKPVICVELYEKADAAEEVRIRAELLSLLTACPVTQSIHTILFHRRFPVDLRHNAKIERPKLAFWATRKMQGNSLKIESLKLIPILGWLYLFILPFFEAASIWWIIWWIDLVLSTLAHIVQIPKGFEAAQIHGYSRKEAAFLTLLLGATWWRPLLPTDRSL